MVWRPYHHTRLDIQSLDMIVSIYRYLCYYWEAPRWLVNVLYLRWCNQKSYKLRCWWMEREKLEWKRTSNTEGRQENDKRVSVLLRTTVDLNGDKSHHHPLRTKHIVLFWCIKKKTFKTHNTKSLLNLCSSCPQRRWFRMSTRWSWQAGSQVTSASRLCFYSLASR